MSEFCEHETFKDICGICHRDGVITRLTTRVAKLEKGLQKLYLSYVNTLEAGRDRIILLGGDCDPVDVMEKGDPALAAARAAINPAPEKGGEQPLSLKHQEAMHGALRKSVKEISNG